MWWNERWLERIGRGAEAGVAFAAYGEDLVGVSESEGREVGCRQIFEVDDWDDEEEVGLEETLEGAFPLFRARSRKSSSS